MNVLLSVFIITIGFNAISIYSEEDTYSDNQDEEYSSIDLMTVPKSSNVEEQEKITTARDDGIVDIDDIIKSTEFNTMFSPETTQVRRFAASLKDHTSDDILKPAKLDPQSKTSSSSDKEKSSKEEKKSGKEQAKSDKKEYKSESKEHKKGLNSSSKSGEKVNTSTENVEKSAIEENESTPLIEEDKKAPSETIDELSSRSGESLIETTDSPRTAFVTADKFPDDMDDLIFPYFLDKIKKNYDDESYDRSQYSESQIILSYEDSTPDVTTPDDSTPDDSMIDDTERDGIKPTRRMFNSPAIRNLDNKATDKQETPKQNSMPDQLVSTTLRPITGTAMPNHINSFVPQNTYQTPVKPPLPYMSNSNAFYPAQRLPQQPILTSALQPFRRFNSFYPQEEIRNSRFNMNRDINAYPYVGPSPLLSRNMGSNELNPIFRKLVEASNSPRHNMPMLVDPSKLPIRSGNFYNNPIDSQFRRPQNFNPYLQRYAY